MAIIAAASVLDQIVEPIISSLNGEAARSLLKIRTEKAGTKRMAVLARKCNEGELTTEERAEYEMNVLAGEFLALLQASARALVAQSKRK